MIFTCMVQVLSGGLLQATPHFVQGAQGPEAHGIARNTFAVFMQPRWAAFVGMPGLGFRVELQSLE